MPPKKAAGEPAVVAILKEAGVTKPEQISDSTLRKIYRLEDDVPAPPEAGPSAGSLDAFVTRAPIHNYKACDNAWDTYPKLCEAIARESARLSKSAKKLKNAASEDAHGRPVLDASCTFAHCRDNPRCLNWLGQSLWEDEKAFDRFAKQWGLSDNPIHEVRDPDLPVGLKNLGATCYVNSYLQVWFQNEPFRKAVFSCALDPNKELSKQPLYHLQVTFAALQQAQLKAFSPVDLVKSLDIDTSDQQDAQEFAKLLMTLLENEFAKQPDPHLKTLIARQFEGKIKYGTRCKTCHYRSENTSSFKELEIPLKNNKSLQEQLAKSLEKELLNGDNKYRCDRCQKLRDAERYTEIVQLPPVLHFSLMRFGYDFVANERKKSSAVIQFPKSIDMSEFVEDSEESDWYDLRGILNHKGTSAHHGHYVAQIYDAKFKEWFLFDDETVSPLELIKDAANKPVKRARTASPGVKSKKTAGATKDKRVNGTAIDLTSSSSDEDSPMTTSGPYRPSKLETPKPCSASSKSASKKRKIEDDSDMEENRVATDELVKSKDAYMLVYVRRGSTSSMDTNEPAIPPLAEQKLDEIDRDLTAQMEEFTADEQECKRKFFSCRDIKRSVYRVWNSTVDEHPGLLVHRDVLQDWLTAEITAPKKVANGKANGTSTKTSRQTSADDSESDCVEVTSTRSPAKSTSAPRSARNGTPVNHKSFKNENGLAGMQEKPFSKGKQKQVEESSDSDTDLPELPKLSLTLYNNVREKSSEPTDTHTTSESNKIQNGDKSRGSRTPPESRSVPKAATSDVHRRKTVRHLRELRSDMLLCPHANVLPSMAAQMKKVSEAGIAALVASGVEISPELITPDNLCRLCVYEPVQNRSYLQEHRENVAEFQRLSTGQSGPSWVSKTWLDDWIKDKPSMHKDGAPTDPPPDDPEYIHEVLCEHDGMVPDESRRVMITGRQTKHLQALFPAWQPVTPERAICNVCKDFYDQRIHQLHTLKQTASAEKTNRILHRISSAPLYTQPEIVATRQDEEMRAVPREWLSAWRTWLKKPTLCERPHTIDLRPFYCKHIGLTSDFDFPDDRKDFEIIFEDEWRALKTIYKSKGGLEIAVMRNSRGRYETRPPVCEACRKERRSSFVEIEIVLKFLVDDDMDKETGLPKTSFNVDDCDDRKRELSPLRTSVMSARRSTRTRTQTGSTAANVKRPQRRKPTRIAVRRLETLKDIRILVQELTKTPTIYQRFFFKNREIDDSAETVESMGITQGEALQVLLLDIPDEDDVDITSFDDVPATSRSRTASKDKPKSNGRPEGFGGTALSGLDATSDQARVAREREEAEIRKALPGRCSRCTYQNNPGLKKCEMCDELL